MGSIEGVMVTFAATNTTEQNLDRNEEAYRNYWT